MAIDQGKRAYLAKKITIIGLVINVLLASIKFLVGLVGHSQAVIADAVHSLSDLATDAIVLIGIRYWDVPPDECHPYGHRRIETLTAGIIVGILALVAFSLIYKAILTLGRKSDAVTIGIVASIGPAISLVVKEILYRVTLKIGRQIQSSAIVANAHHHRSDALSSLPALIAVCLASINPKLIHLDSLGSILVSCLILKSAWDIIRPNVRELVDGVDSNFKGNHWIREQVLGVNGVLDAHGIRTRTHGGCLLIDLHILVDPDLTIKEGHAIAEQVKKALISREKNVIDVMVHVEPFEAKKKKG